MPARNGLVGGAWVVNMIVRHTHERDGKADGARWESFFDWAGRGGEWTGVDKRWTRGGQEVEDDRGTATNTEEEKEA